MRSPLARIGPDAVGSAGVPEIVGLDASRAFELHAVADQRPHPAQIGQHGVDVDAERTIARQLHPAAGVDVGVDHCIEPSKRFPSYVRSARHAIADNAERGTEVADADRVQGVNSTVDIAACAFDDKDAGQRIGQVEVPAAAERQRSAIASSRAHHPAWRGGARVKPLRTEAVKAAGRVPASADALHLDRVELCAARLEARRTEASANSHATINGVGSFSRNSSGRPLSAMTNEPRHAPSWSAALRQPPFAVIRTGCSDSVVPVSSSVCSAVVPRPISVALASDASGLGARWPLNLTVNASGAVAATPPARDTTVLSIVWPLANFRSVAVASI